MTNPNTTFYITNALKDLQRDFCIDNFDLGFLSSVFKEIEPGFSNRHLYVCHAIMQTSCAPAQKAMAYALVHYIIKGYPTYDSWLSAIGHGYCGADREDWIRQIIVAIDAVYDQYKAEQKPVCLS